MSEDDVLPEAYAPFRPVLGQLSEPLATLLSGQLAQFEQLAWNLEGRECADHGQFEGLGGLTRHGEIDHILQSELLLRTEAPLEFMRRLVEAETLYHERIYVDPGARQIVRALVSVGPGIMGHGRIVALAALFLLNRIALRRGARFYWCFVPRSDGAVWFDGLSVNAIKRFLRSASYREAEEADIRAANESWVDTDGTATDAAIDFADWLIGASLPARRAAGAAVHSALNVLGFALRPPVRAEPRIADIRVRRRGREARRAAITFLDEGLCLSALEQPFPRPRPEQATAPHQGDAVPAMTSWEPQYLSIASANFRFVRSKDGLSVIRTLKEDTGEAVWFVPLGAETILAGASMEKNTLVMLCHVVRDGMQALSLRRFHLVTDAVAQSPFHRSHGVPSSHLFKGRQRHALPMLCMHSGNEFYSTSGQAYVLQFGIEEEVSSFVARYGAGRTFFGNGTHRIVGSDIDGAPVLQAMKRKQALMATFALAGCDELPKAFHGLAWSATDMALAYSLRAGEWSVATGLSNEPALYRAPDLDFRVAPCERVMAAGRGATGVWARIWSDAAYGGDGTVELLDLTLGQRKRRLPPLPLGRHGAAIAAFVMAEDGYWAVAVDGDGEPEHLIHYRQNKHSGAVRETSFAMADLRARAIVLDSGDWA